jgi:hypothetical protein
MARGVDVQGSFRRFALALAGAIAVSAAVPGIGAAAPAPPSLSPGTPVARVGDVTITFGALEQLRRSRLAPLLSSDRGAADCLEQERRGRPLSGDCTRSFQRLRRELLAFDLSLHHAVAETRRLGIAVPREPSSPADRRLIRSFGMPAALQALMLRALAAQEALKKAWERRLPAASEAELERLWGSKRDVEWFTPHQRWAELLELPDRASAERALAAIRGGESFAAVGARLLPARRSTFTGAPQLFVSPQPESIESLLLGEGDELLAELPPRLRSTLFHAPVGALRGPIATERAVFVLRVTEIVTVRARRPLPQVRTLLEAELRELRLERIGLRHERAAARRWRARTTCDRRIAPRSVCGRVVARVKG